MCYLEIQRKPLDAKSQVPLQRTERAISAPSQHATGQMNSQWLHKVRATSMPAEGRNLGWRSGGGRGGGGKVGAEEKHKLCSQPDLGLRPASPTC